MHSSVKPRIGCHAGGIYLHKVVHYMIMAVNKESCSVHSYVVKLVIKLEGIRNINLMLICTIED